MRLPVGAATIVALDCALMPSMAAVIVVAPVATAVTVPLGATVTMPAQDMFWGDRFGSLADPFGHLWSIATHKEDLSDEEIAERSKAAMAEMGAG